MRPMPGAATARRRSSREARSKGNKKRPPLPPQAAGRGEGSFSAHSTAAEQRALQLDEAGRGERAGPRPGGSDAGGSSGGGRGERWPERRIRERRRAASLAGARVTGALGGVLARRAPAWTTRTASRVRTSCSDRTAVRSVAISGFSAGKPSEGCIKTALGKAHVPPFAEASYGATVTVRALTGAQHRLSLPRSRLRVSGGEGSDSVYFRNISGVRRPRTRAVMNPHERSAQSSLALPGGHHIPKTAGSGGRMRPPSGRGVLALVGSIRPRGRVGRSRVSHGDDVFIQVGVGALGASPVPAASCGCSVSPGGRVGYASESSSTPLPASVEPLASTSDPASEPVPASVPPSAPVVGQTLDGSPESPVHGAGPVGLPTVIDVTECLGSIGVHGVDEDITRGPGPCDEGSGCRIK